MNSLYALCASPEAAQRAVDSLREAGVDAREIVVLSSEPYEDYHWGAPEQHTRMGWLAALGGLLGGLAGLLLTAFTQRVYPIVTGAMPLAPWWTNGIIIYEMTMLGIILTTLLTLLISARLLRWKPQVYDPGIFEGKILVGLVKPPETSRAELEERLRRCGEVRQGEPEGR